MALVDLTVRRARTKFNKGRNYASETWAVDDSCIVSAIPSICKKDTITDGLVNAKVKLRDCDHEFLWVTQTVATISALS